MLSAWVLSLAVPALSQEGSGIGISLAPVRVEFFRENPEPKTVTIYLRGGSRGTVSASMLDFVVVGDGRRQTVGYGTTDSTLDGYLTIAPESFDYVPDGTEQRFDVTLTIDPAVADDVRFGQLVATFTPEGSGEGAGASVTAGVGIEVLTAQAAEDIPAADLRLVLDALDVRAEKAWTPVDRLLPDIPGVVGHGPAVLAAAGRNVGDYFLDEVTVFEVRRVSPLVLLPFIDEGEPRPILRVSMTPRYTLPGQAFDDETTTRILLEDGGEVDAMPFIGFVRVTAIATGRLGGAEARPTVLTRTVLVFPWSEALFVFVVWLVRREYRHRQGRKVNAADAPPPPTLRTRIRERLRRVLPLRGGRAPEVSVDTTEAPPENPAGGGPDQDEGEFR